MDADLKREVILDNYSNPYNKGQSNNENSIKINSHSESCIDDIDLYVDIEDDIIKDIHFDGEACALSTASTSIMIKNLVGKSIGFVEEYARNFKGMINEEEYDDSEFNEAIVFDETYKQGNRKTCVTLPVNAILRAIDEYKLTK